MSGAKKAEKAERKPVRLVNYVRVALAAERSSASMLDRAEGLVEPDEGLIDAAAMLRALSDIASARAAGSRGLGERVDTVLEALLETIEG